MLSSKEVHLLRYPSGTPSADDFALVEVSVSETLAPDEVLIRNLYLSVDPYMRGRMSGRRTYVDPFPLNTALEGGAIGIVLKSRNPALPEGQLVQHMYGWRELFKTTNIHHLKPRATLKDIEPSAWLGVLGMPGMTAYAGLLEVAAMKPGETVFVSGAAGAVGSLVGQIAKLKGGFVVGSAGSDSKALYLTKELGFDRAFNYKSGSITKALAEAAPQGIDIYFDNVGGEHLDAALLNMRDFGRIALCGAIAQYNDETPSPGPRHLTLAIARRLRLQGFIVSDFPHLAADFERDMQQWIQNGQVSWRETTVRGIDQMVQAFLGLFSGKNLGKMLIQV